MARRQIFSSFSVCQLGFLGGVSLDVLPWLGWQKHTFLDPDTWCVQGPNFDDLCACLSQCKCMLSLFTVPKLSSCYVFLMHPFLLGCDDNNIHFSMLKHHCSWLFKDQILMSSVRVWASAPLFTVWTVWSLFVIHGVSIPNSGSIMFFWFTCGDNLSIKWC